MTIKHILFPIDFSERTFAAVPFVESMARTFGAGVTLMSVMAPPLPYIGMGEPMSPIIIDVNALKDDMQNRLDRVVLKDLGSLTVRRIVEIGEAATAITQFARTESVDLIMMPTHGYGPFRQMLLGSVTAKVLHDAVCPVWTGAHLDEPPGQEHIACRNLICAIDGTSKSLPVLRWAAEFAKHGGSALRLVHAVPAFEAWPESQFDRQFELTLRNRALEEIGKLERSLGIEAAVCVGSGTPGDVVCEEARAHNTDLVVIGRGVLNEALGRLRTHAYQIVRQSPCPVISV